LKWVDKDTFLRETADQLIAQKDQIVRFLDQLERNGYVGVRQSPLTIAVDVQDLRETRPKEPLPTLDTVRIPSEPAKE
jgi:hypothetical protein